MRRTRSALLTPAALVAVLTVVLAGTLLSACAGDGSASDRAEEPGTPPTASPTTTPSDQPVPTPAETLTDTGSDGWRLVEIVHATAAGGSTSGTPSPIGEASQRATFTSQFTRAELPEEIDRIARTTQARPGSKLVAAVIAIGCDVPPGVTYVDGEVIPDEVADPLPNCFAPVTSVAVLEIEE